MRVSVKFANRDLDVKADTVHKSIYISSSNKENSPNYVHFFYSMPYIFGSRTPNPDELRAYVFNNLEKVILKETEPGYLCLLSSQQEWKKILVRNYLRLDQSADIDTVRAAFLEFIDGCRISKPDFRDLIRYI